MQINPHGCRIKPAPDPNPALIAEVIEHLRRHHFAPGTLRTYKTVLRELVATLGGRPLTAATRDDLKAWQAGQDHKGNKAATIVRKQGAVRVFYHWLLETERIQKDPTTGLVRPKVPKRLPIHLTEAEIERLFAVLRWDTYMSRRQATIIKALYYTGMRASELINLTVERWDRQAGTLRIVGKGDKERVVFVVPQLEAVLDDWMRDHPTGKGPLLCYPTTGSMIGYQALRVDVKKAMVAAGIPDYTAHKLRHTFATQLLRKGVSLDKIQKLLGHEQITTTQVYAHTEIGEEMKKSLATLL